MNLGKLVQEQMLKYGNTEITESTSKRTVNFDQIQESLGSTYRKLTGNETIKDKMSSAADKVKETASEAKEKMSSVAGKIGKKASEAAEEAKEHIKEHPKTAAAIGAGAGLVSAGFAAHRFANRKKK